MRNGPVTPHVPHACLSPVIFLSMLLNYDFKINNNALLFHQPLIKEKENGQRMLRKTLNSFFKVKKVQLKCEFICKYLQTTPTKIANAAIKD
ncbi:hypothetical protein BpHYR1_054467 [Brachionus plicatilis]|uniref:Uncharacterized protein n=1 Tax=Brachionus plicatilis TaxID=10195 RepID=A0A3M7PI92_BRAPC|nr:hypothetical protein BpHYR1_054467 [Brachionus plicatilis]